MNVYMQFCRLKHEEIGFKYVYKVTKERGKYYTSFTNPFNIAV